MLDRTTSGRGRGPVARNHRAVPTGFLGAIQGFVGHSEQLLKMRTHGRVADAEACRKGGSSTCKQVLGKFYPQPLDYLVAEGATSELDRLLAEIAEAMSGNVRDVHVNAIAVNDELRAGKPREDGDACLFDFRT